MPTKVQKACEACGAPISVRLADHRRGWGRFCDKACAAAHKVGMRPRDVNAHHAKFSGWAKDRLAHREAHGVSPGVAVWPKIPSVKDQVGRKVKVKPIYHSPSHCRECGVPINGPGLCDEHEMHEQAMFETEQGWDGHKGMF